MPWFPHLQKGGEGGGLCARLSLRPPKLKEILNSDLSLPACQSAFRANRLAPLNGCFPHPPNWRYFIPERTVSSLTYPISFKVSPFYFEVQRKRRFCIMSMVPLKCSPCSCRLADSAPARARKLLWCRYAPRSLCCTSISTGLYCISSIIHRTQCKWSHKFYPPH